MTTKKKITNTKFPGEKKGENNSQSIGILMNTQQIYCIVYVSKNVKTVKEHL